MSNTTTKSRMTKQARVLNALKEGQALTSADIRNRYKAGNPQAVIQALRFAGNPIYLNTVKSSTGRKTLKYRLGTPSKALLRLVIKQWLIEILLYNFNFKRT